MAANSNSLTPTPNPTPPNAQPETPISSLNPQIPDTNPSSPPRQSSHSTPNPDNATQDATPPSQKHTKSAPSAVYETRKIKKSVLHSSASPKQPRVDSPIPVSARTCSTAQNPISPQVSSTSIRVQSPLHHSPTVSQTAPVIPPSGSQVNSSYPWTFRDFEMRKNYEALAKKKILATKYIDEHSFREIGLYESVSEYLKNIGWSDFARIQEPASRELTIEFLSSLQLDFQPMQSNHKDTISFRCLG
ncbi:extensin-like [Hevea brasiliensis]|uniref:extensin-like n=1 Tax=Hevea brasiliensis TaxID=3981 RepID=UPI0025FE3C08|nr:extensin-like [Hevea brasiliensis]